MVQIHPPVLKMKDKLDEEFEKLWEEYFQDMLNNYNQRHKNKFTRWLAKPDYLVKDSLSYKMHKSIAKLFYTKGILYEQQEILALWNEK